MTAPTCDRRYYRTGLATGQEVMLFLSYACRHRSSFHGPKAVAHLRFFYNSTTPPGNKRGGLATTYGDHEIHPLGRSSAAHEGNLCGGKTESAAGSPRCKPPCDGGHLCSRNLGLGGSPGLASCHTDGSGHECRCLGCSRSAVSSAFIS